MNAALPPEFCEVAANCLIRLSTGVRPAIRFDWQVIDSPRIGGNFCSAPKRLHSIARANAASEPDPLREWKGQQRPKAKGSLAVELLYLDQLGLQLVIPAKAGIQRL